MGDFDFSSAPGEAFVTLRGGGVGFNSARRFTCDAPARLRRRLSNELAAPGAAEAFVEAIEPLFSSYETLNAALLPFSFSLEPMLGMPGTTGKMP